MMTHALTIRQIAEKVKEVFLVAFLTLRAGFSVCKRSCIFVKEDTVETTVIKLQKTRCGATIFLSWALTVLMCCLTTPDDTTISAMQVREPILGVLWAVATALAVYLNLNYLRKKCGVENTCFQIFVTIGSAAALLTPFTMSESPIGFSLPFINLHRAVCHGFRHCHLCGAGHVAVCRRNGTRSFIRFFPVCCLLWDWSMCMEYLHHLPIPIYSALMETCLVLVGLTVLFLVNFLLDDPAQQKSGEKIDAKSDDAFPQPPSALRF